MTLSRASASTTGRSATNTEPARTELDCAYEAICENCSFFQTTIEFRPDRRALDLPQSVPSFSIVRVNDDFGVVNNIFKANSGYAVEFQTSTATGSITEADHNNLFTSGSFMARIASTNYGTLASWQAATSRDANSVSYDPQFQSNTELYASDPAALLAASRDAEM